MSIQVEQVEKDRQEFADTLRYSCEQYLKPSIIEYPGIDHYVTTTLSELHWGEDEPYKNEMGNEYHYEIPSHHSVDGCPHVVSI